MQATKRKRARVSPQRERTLVWRARGSGTQYRVHFSCPGPDEQCVISGESIQEARPEWLPDEINTFFPDDRTLKKATLPCAHSFAATPLAYHFLKNCMRCPVCRSGEDQQLDSRVVPPALRHALLLRVRHTTTSEAAQQREEDHAATLLEIRRVILDEIAQLHNPFSMTTRVVDSDTLMLRVTYDTRHWVAFTLRRDPHSSPQLIFSIPRAALRELRREMYDTRDSQITMCVLLNGVPISCAPSLQLPCAAGEPPTWTEHNRALLCDTGDAAEIAMFDPESRERQRSTLHMRHTLRQNCVAEDAVFPFTAVQWHMDASELMQFIMLGAFMES